MSHYRPEATVIPIWKTPICKQGACKWGILKHPVFNVLNFRGWIKLIYDNLMFRTVKTGCFKIHRLQTGVFQMGITVASGHCLIFENEATSTDNQNSKFEFIHHFPLTSSSFQIAHLVECEGLVWMVLGSSPGEVVFCPFCGFLNFTISSLKCHRKVKSI